MGCWCHTRLAQHSSKHQRLSLLLGGLCNAFMSCTPNLALVALKSLPVPPTQIPTQATVVPQHPCPCCPLSPQLLTLWQTVCSLLVSGSLLLSLVSRQATVKTKLCAATFSRAILSLGAVACLLQATETSLGTGWINPQQQSSVAAM
jgi:hypothetical protein